MLWWCGALSGATNRDWTKKDRRNGATEREARKGKSRERTDDARKVMIRVVMADGDREREEVEVEVERKKKKRSRWWE